MYKLSFAFSFGAVGEAGGRSERKARQEASFLKEGSGQNRTKVAKQRRTCNDP